MSYRCRSLLLLAAGALLAGCFSNHDSTVGADPTKMLVNVDESGVALQGYDPLGYFDEGRPVKGDPMFHAEYAGATYHFESAAHRDQFTADPARYAPQFGGYCGYAASIDKVSPISVEYFQVLDGRLVLQHNQKAWDLWNKDVPGNLVRADANWPDLVQRYGK